MYGDGFVQDSHAMPWTPFECIIHLSGEYKHSLREGFRCMRHFQSKLPRRISLSMASAVLLRKCFVSISKHKAEGAYLRAATGSIFFPLSQLFRPVDIAFGFDGAMYVSDFCSRIIGHAQGMQ